MEKVNSCSSSVVEYQVESDINCFICKLPVNSKSSRVRSWNESALGCSRIEAILKIWELSDESFHNIQDTEEINSSVLFCRKCNSNVQRILKIFQDLEDLQKQLRKLKISIEKTIRRKFNLNTADDISYSKINYSKDMAIFDMIRRHIVQKSTYKKFDVPVCENNTPIENSHVVVLDENVTEQDEMGKIKTCQYQVEDPGLFATPDKYDINDLVENFCEQAAPQNIEDGFDQEEEDEARLKCSKCRSTFKDEIGRTAHIKKIHEGIIYPYLCSECNKKFKSRRQLTIHQMIHTGENPYICEHCGKGFRAMKLLKLHLKLMHIGGLKYFCKQCGKGFLTPSKLTVHEISHTKEYPVSCSDCGKGFVSKTALDLHLVSHMPINPFVCSDCNKPYSSARALERHRSVHTQNFKYRCSICTFGTSSSKCDLERHMMKHQSEKLLECNVCNKNFKYQKTLQKHLKTHKDRERKFQCSLCGKSFYENHQLVKHIRTHEDSRPFLCEICHKRFNFKQYLTEHLKVHERMAIATPVPKKRSKKTKTKKPETQEPEMQYAIFFQQEAIEPQDSSFPSAVQENHSELESITPIVMCDLGSADIFSVNLFQPIYEDL